MAKGDIVNPAAALGEATRFADLRQRLIFLVGALVVYRIGTFIPVPGIDPVALDQFFPGSIRNDSEHVQHVLGRRSGAAEHFCAGHHAVHIGVHHHEYGDSRGAHADRSLKKEGEAGRRKISQYTRYGTLVLATFQSLGATMALQNQGMALNPGWNFVFTAAVTLVTGTVFLMWLGEQITERGIGNGISMIILSSIISGLPSAIGGTLQLVETGEMAPALALILILLVIGVTAVVVFLERGQRRITVNYAKRQQGRKLYQSQSSHLPFKINMAGVIPPIFASSIILFPATIASWFGTAEGMGWLQTLAAQLSPGQPIYILLYASLIMFFCFFYTALVFNSNETADNLKKSGAFIPGIRPGQQTAEYIDKVLTRLTFWGGLYIMTVCLLPEFMILYWRVPFYFGGTSLLIIVVVTMDFMSQLQAHMMSHQYEGMLKKANLRGYGRAGQLR